MKAEGRRQKAESEGLRDFRDDGFVIVEDLISPGRCDELAEELSGLFYKQQSSSRKKIGGVRNLLQTSPLVAATATGKEISELLRIAIRRSAFPVRAIFFDKTPDANWLVPWHQDLSIAVAERIETPGFNGWSLKEGVTHVQPPREILETMMAVRLHLDDCDVTNGALKVIPGSHRLGKLDATQIAELSSHEDAFVCEIHKGSVLLLHPLLLHASSPSEKPAHRRVLHIEYATAELPGGLKWFEYK